MDDRFNRKDKPDGQSVQITQDAKGNPILHHRLALDPASTEEARQGLLDSTTVTATFRHAQVLAVREVRLDDGALVFVQDFPHGPLLADRIEQDGPLPLAQAFTLMRAFAQGLGAAQAAGLTISQICPTEFVLQEVPTEGLICLCPPVPAGWWLDVEDHGFASPEQAAAQPCDIRSSLFSAGAVLAHMITGKRPVDASGWLSILNTAKLSTTAHQALKAALETDPANRCATPAAWIALMDTALEEALAPATPKAPPAKPAPEPVLAAPQQELETNPIAANLRSAPPAKPRFAALAPSYTPIETLGPRNHSLLPMAALAAVVILGIGAWLFWPQKTTTPVPTLASVTAATPAPVAVTPEPAPAPQPAKVIPVNPPAPPTAEAKPEPTPEPTPKPVPPPAPEPAKVVAMTTPPTPAITAPKPEAKPEAKPEVASKPAPAPEPAKVIAMTTPSPPPTAPKAEAKPEVKPDVAPKPAPPPEPAKVIAMTTPAPPPPAAPIPEAKPEAAPKPTPPPAPEPAKVVAMTPPAPPPTTTKPESKPETKAEVVMKPTPPATPATKDELLKQAAEAPAAAKSELYHKVLALDPKNAAALRGLVEAALAQPPPVTATDELNGWIETLESLNEPVADHATGLIAAQHAATLEPAAAIPALTNAIVKLKRSLHSEYDASYTVLLQAYIDLHNAHIKFREKPKADRVLKALQDEIAATPKSISGEVPATFAQSIEDDLKERALKGPPKMQEAFLKTVAANLRALAAKRGHETAEPTPAEPAKPVKPTTAKGSTKKRK